MLKIHIMGGLGSGKTTLGKEIASRFALPCYDLDTIGMSNEVEQTDAAYIQNAFTLAAQPGWVTEGIYLITTDPFLDYADSIVLLEVSWRTAAYRIVRRHISRNLRGTNPYPGIRGLVRFLKNVRAYYLNRSDARTAEIMRTYLEEHRTSAEPLDMEQLLARLETYGDDVVLAPTEEFVRSYLEKYRQKVICVRKNADRERLFALLAQHQ
jgi:adenylate kinase family enzyme